MANIGREWNRWGYTSILFREYQRALDESEKYILHAQKAEDRQAARLSMHYAIKEARKAVRSLESIRYSIGEE